MWNPRRACCRRAIGALLVVAAMAVGCSSGAGDEGSNAARVEAIQRARDAVVEPAQSLGTAAADVAADLDRVVARPDEDAVEATRAAVADLADARSEVAALDLDAGTVDVREAQAALQAATGAARTVEEAATRVLDAAARAVEADERLQAWVAAWDEPGSRSQLITRLEEVAAAAEAMAAEESTPSSRCPGPMAVRRAAAQFVATATRDLAALVVARDGVAFDARRGELAEAPFGVDDAGVARGPAASIDPDACPAVADVEDAATDVAEALRDLQQALNPEDLAG